MNKMGIIKNLTILVQIPLSDSSFINDSFSTCDQVVVLNFKLDMTKIMGNILQFSK